MQRLYIFFILDKERATMFYNERIKVAEK